MIKEWHIWDFPGNIYVLIKKEVREEFFREMYKKFGSQKNYAKYLEKTADMVRKYHYAKDITFGKEYKVYIPASVIKKSRPFLNKELEKLIEDNIITIRTPPNSEIKNPKLPIKECKEVYRILGHLIGDGSGPEAHQPYYCNSCKKLREQFKEDLKIFGDVNTKEINLNPTFGIAFPSVLCKILSHIFDVKFTRPYKLPSRIWNTKKEYRVEILKALFDDEGTISPHLAISMKNKNLMSEIKFLLNSLEIKISKNLIKKYTKEGSLNWGLNISTKFYKKFDSIIGFYHPNKDKNLKIAIDIIDNSKMNMSKLNRPFAAINLRKEMIKFLSRSYYSTFELSKLILANYFRVHRNMIALEKQNIVERFGFKNKIKWKLRS